MLNHQCTVDPPGGYEEYTSQLLKTQQREKGQKSRQRHVSAVAGGSDKTHTDKRPNNPSAAAIAASTASEASVASGDLWRLQNKFPTQDFEQDLHPFQENLVGGLGLRSNSGNYTRLPQPQPQPTVSRPNSQHIYVDLDSSNSSFSSASGAAEPETPQTGSGPTGTTQCHNTPRSYVVSQC